MREVTSRVQVPPNVGVRGFLHALGEILKVPKLQDLQIDMTGMVLYRHFVPDEEFTPLKVDFSHLEPYSIVRNSRLEEQAIHKAITPVETIHLLFEKIDRKELFPICWVTGAATTLFKWINIEPREVFFGLPVYRDRHCEDNALILCASLGRGVDLVDVQLALKVSML